MFAIVQRKTTKYIYLNVAVRLSQLSVPLSFSWENILKGSSNYFEPQHGK